MALLGAPASVHFPHAVTAIPVPHLHSTFRPPTGYLSLLGLDSFLHPSFLGSPPFPPHFHFCCHFVSALPFPLLLTNFFSIFFFPLFLCFLLFPIGSFSPLPLLLRHFSSCPSLPQFITKRLNSLSEFQCHWIGHCSHLLPRLVPTPFSSPHDYVPWSPGSAYGNFTME